MRFLLCVILLLLTMQQLCAQGVGIGTPSPDASAMLDIQSTSKGLLIPRMDSLQRAGITAPVAGLLVYQTNKDSGFYYYSGSRWTRLAIEGNGWGTGGNAGLNETHFIGTTDNTPLVFKVNNQPAGIVSNTRGNTSFGRLTLAALTEGIYNMALGDEALMENTIGAYNIAIGQTSLKRSVTAAWNCGVGNRTLAYLRAGNYNTAVGNDAMFQADSGSNNVAVGFGSLVTSKGAYNVAVGMSSMQRIIRGERNTAIGARAMIEADKTDNNTVVGYEALRRIKYGGSNTVLGFGCMSLADSGSYNVAVGEHALAYMKNANSNTALGTYSLYANATGSLNTAVGASALVYNNAVGNTGVGVNAMYFNTTGQFNVAIGYQALSSNSTGNHNTALGYAANVAAMDLTNATAIGYNAVVDASNKVVIGNNSVTAIGGYAPWSNYSDARLKKDITDNTLGLDFILRLRPVSYRWNTGTNDRLTDGFIAQEVETVLKELGQEFSGLHVPDNENGRYMLSYEQLVVPLVNAVKQQQKKIDSLEEQLIALQKIVLEIKQKNNLQ